MTTDDGGNAAGPKPSRGFIFASFAYLTWATLAAFVAITQGMPAAFGGMKSDLPAWRDFVYGMGTALSPPLWFMLAQAALTVLAARRGRLGAVAAALVTLFGFAEVVGAAGEPITLRVLAPATFDPLLAVIQAGMLILPALVLILGIRTLRHRWATRNAA